jgi:hypothetical protein
VSRDGGLMVKGCWIVVAWRFDHGLTTAATGIGDEDGD